MIIVTIKDTKTGKEYQREINPLSEFYGNSHQAQVIYIEEWIRDRANAQHDSIMGYVSHKVVNLKTNL